MPLRLKCTIQIYGVVMINLKAVPLNVPIADEIRELQKSVLVPPL